MKAMPGLWPIVIVMGWWKLMLGFGLGALAATLVEFLR